MIQSLSHKILMILNEPEVVASGFLVTMHYCICKFQP